MEATLLGVGALIAAVTGLVNAWVGLRRARQEGHQECLAQLREARAEAETATRELHRIHMDHPGEW